MITTARNEGNRDAVSNEQKHSSDSAADVYSQEQRQGELGSELAKPQSGCRDSWEILGIYSSAVIGDA